MKSIQLFIVLCLVILSLSACKQPKTELEAVETWKYSEGFYIGEIMVFNDVLNSLKTDTIYRHNMPVATLVKITSNPGSKKQTAIIQDLRSSEQGKYTSK